MMFWSKKRRWIWKPICLPPCAKDCRPEILCCTPTGFIFLCRTPLCSQHFVSHADWFSIFCVANRMMFNILCRGTVSSPCFVSQHKQSDSFCVVSQPVSSQILPGLPNFFINRSAETHPSLFSLFFLKAFWLQNFKPNLLNNYHYADAPKSFVRFCVETRPLLTQIDFFTLLNAFGLQTFKPNLWNNYLRNLRCRTQIFGRFCVETRPLLTQIDFLTLLTVMHLGCKPGSRTLKTDRWQASWHPVTIERSDLKTSAYWKHISDTKLVPCHSLFLSHKVGPRQLKIQQTKPEITCPCSTRSWKIEKQAKPHGFVWEASWVSTSNPWQFSTKNLCQTCLALYVFFCSSQSFTLGRWLLERHRWQWRVPLTNQLLGPRFWPLLHTYDNSGFSLCTYLSGPVSAAPFSWPAGSVPQWQHQSHYPFND